MLAQQQNPHALSYSLQPQQVHLKEINSEGESDVKTFSIRQYAFGCRQRSLFQSWPFPEKYLQMCLNRGLRNVLPPFGLRDNNNNSSIPESSRDNGIPNLNEPCDEDYEYDDKNVRVLKSESSPPPLELMKKQNIMNHSDDSGFVLSNEEERSKAMMMMMMMMTSLQREEGVVSAPDHNCVTVNNNKSSQICSSNRRRRRKGRCKKRSMADILAVAKRCTLEEIYRINQFSYAATGNMIHETATLDQNDPKSNNGAANFDVNVNFTS